MPSSDFQPNQVWSSALPSGTEDDLTTPSGQTCRAKKMSIETMIAEGLLAEADSLTAVVAKHTRKVKGGKKADTTAIDVPSLMKDGKAVADVIGLVDRIMPRVIVSPVVMLHYGETIVGKTKVTKLLTPEDRALIHEKNPGKQIVFTDQIGLEDKMFIFDWAAGGLGAMLNFRE